MKRNLLFCVSFVMFAIASCSKSKNDTIESNAAPTNVFTQVLLFGGPGSWGGGFCSYGYVMVRQDTSIFYHSLAIPAGANTNPNPVLVKILYHDTIIPQSAGCWPNEIVVDSIKQ